MRVTEVSIQKHWHRHRHITININLKK
jgi:hypothetical protein